MNVKLFLEKVLSWRANHISDRNFMIILAVSVGVAVGFATIILKSSVHFVRNVAVFLIERYSFSYLYIIFPAIGIFLTILFVKFILKKQLGHGIPMVLYSISRKEGKIEKHNMFSRIIASSLTVGFGGSVGLEGPIVATGGAIGSNIGQICGLKYNQVVLLIGCACTASIAAIFKAPIAAIIFAIEVIMLDLTTGSLLLLLVSSISASLTTYFFLGQGFIYYVYIDRAFNLSDVPYYLILGVLAGLISVYFSKMYLMQNRYYDRISNWFYKFLIGASILGGLIFFFPSLYGEGFEAINSALHGDTSHLFDNTIYGKTSDIFFISIIIFCIIIFKTFATGATFGAGGVGGIFAPSLFLGSYLGLVFSKIVNSFGLSLSVSSFAIVGMAGVMAGVIHAPLTAIFMVAEVTGGYKLFVPIMIVATISYFVTKLFMHNSVYTILLAKKGHLITHNTDSNALTLMKIEPLLETNFLTISEDATLGDLTKVIAKSSRTLYVVVDEDNRLKGLVWLASVKHLMFNPDLYDNTFVKDLMFVPEPIISVGMNVREIVNLFECTDNYNIPVVDDGVYIGFVSRARIFSKYRELVKDSSSD